MAAADWKHLLTPTTAEIDVARERSRSDAMLLSLQRTVMAALFTLAEEGFVLDVTKGTMTDGDYIALSARLALEVTKDAPPLSRAGLAARLLGWCASFFEHVMAPGEPDHVLHYEIMLAIGYHAGMLSLDEVGLFDVANAALAAKKGRGDAIRERNLAKTAWHTDAQAKARRIRQTFPKRSASQVAEAIHNDPTIASPSYQQAYDMVLAWEKDGTIPRKKKAGEI